MFFVFNFLTEIKVRFTDSFRYIRLILIITVKYNRFIVGWLPHAKSLPRSYRKQKTNLYYKSIDWFLDDVDAQWFKSIARILVTNKATIREKFILF